MRIERISIDGFGQFAGAEFGPFEDNVVVILGPNEAGKTTLLAFIHAILFGFPRKNDAGWVPALAGGKHGGRIVLADDAGRGFTVERHQGPHGGQVSVTSPDGTVAGREQLAELLGHTSPDIFENVFAFGLDQLQSIASLRGSEIYSVGTGALHLPKALDDLTKRAAEIYLPRGETQPVAKLFAQLDELEHKLQEKQNAVGAYDGLHQTLTGLDEQIAALHETLRCLREKRSLIDVVLDAGQDVQGALAELKDARNAADRERPGAQLDDDTHAARRSALRQAREGWNGLEIARRQLDTEQQRLAEARGHMRSTRVPAIGLGVAALVVLVGFAMGGGLILMVGLLLAVAFAAVWFVQFSASERQRPRLNAQARRVQEARATYEGNRQRLEEALCQLDIPFTAEVPAALDAVEQRLDTARAERAGHERLLERIGWAQQQFEVRQEALRQAQLQLQSRHGIAGNEALPGQLAEQVARIESEIDEHERELGALHRSHGATEHEIRQLEGDTSAAALRVDRERLLEELRGEADEWASYVLARELLARARQRYEEERQPAVVQTAQRYFETITGGKYDRIIVPVDAREILVAEPNRTPKPDAALSRGAREQLYLALRFGLISGLETARLPVAVDDILVNFDPQRARATAEAFVELAQTNQVIVFTCHPSTVEHFKSASPDVQIVELENAASIAR